MTKWTDNKLKKEAKSDYEECYECGHYPTWTKECKYFNEEDWQQWAEEYDMTIEEFKKYVNYFFECDSNQL